MTKSIIIIGASAAGVSAARTLRAEKYGGDIILIDGDKDGAYERPPLSKVVLQNSDIKPSDIALLSQADADELNIITKYGSRCICVTIDGTVTLEDGEQLHGDSIILATGGVARELAIEGIEQAGVHVLRNFQDASQLRNALKVAQTVAVVGGGLIGSEVVAVLAGLGKNVHWIDAAPKPLEHIMPNAMVSPLLEWHLSEGVQLTVNARIQSFEALENTGPVTAIHFTDGSQLSVDAVVMGVGMVPDLSLAETIGLNIEVGGIAVNECQQTSADNIYAAGDVAALRQADGTYARHEHWQAAEHQGMNAALSILGLEPVPHPIAWYWSDQGNNHLEMVGHKGEHSIIRQGAEDIWPTVFEMEGNQLVGALSINDPTPVRIATRLIKTQKIVSAEELADPSVDLRQLLRR